MQCERVPNDHLPECGQQNVGSRICVLLIEGKVLRRLLGLLHVLEGEWPRERLIVAEFPSMERAQQWWVSPEYAEPEALRQATADSELVIVQGV